MYFFYPKLSAGDALCASRLLFILFCTCFGRLLRWLFDRFFCWLAAFLTRARTLSLVVIRLSVILFAIRVFLATFASSALALALFIAVAIASIKETFGLAGL